MSAGEHFRLVTVGGGGGGFQTLSAVYDSVDTAVVVAEGLLAALAVYPHKRPFRVDVQDVWTRETVASVRADTVRDPDLCVACGQPNDPFAGDPPQLWPDGGKGAREGLVLPAAEASAPPRLPEVE